MAPLSEGKDRLVVVVGGARGIGEATSELFRDRGYRVVIADINAELGPELGRRIGGQFEHIDVSEQASIEHAAKSIEEKYGAVYGVAMCAAIFQPRVPLEETPIETWDRILTLNARGTYLVDVTFARRMAARGTGSIVNLSSWSSMRSTPQHAYSASKAAINILTEGMATEWGRSGVRFNFVMPGFVLVPRMIEQLKEGKRYTGHPKDLSALGRLVEPREVAEAIAFLISERASAITGASIVVDAGVMVTPSWDMYGGAPAARPRSA